MGTIAHHGYTDFDVNRRYSWRELDPESEESLLGLKRYTDSRKAQQLLGLVTIHDGVGNGRGRVPLRALGRTRSRSEERPPRLHTVREEVIMRHERSATAQGWISPDTWNVQRVEGVRSRIASSMSARKSAFVNFSRPLSQLSPRNIGIPEEYVEPSPRINISKEQVKRNLTLNTQWISRDDLGVPPTPSRVGSKTQAKPIFGLAPSHTIKSIKEVGDERDNWRRQESYRHRRSKRWASLPTCLMWFGKRRPTEPETPLTVRRVDFRQSSVQYGSLPLTEDNLRQYENQVGWVPKPLNHDLLPKLPTPVVSPFDVSIKSPLFPRFSREIMDKRLPTPPQSSSSAYADEEPCELPGDSPASIDPEYVMAYPPQMSTCEVCKDSKSPLSFPVRQCSTKCTHPPHACVDCIRKWIGECIDVKGWDQCICPECGEDMEYEDIKFFATEEIWRRYAYLYLCYMLDG